ncbi:kinase-like domain-containing protein [Armillaria luteobubalina]|uniref:Kinase-like domain-containing protein n=1 Tax=Armillaria luteobubalina TaxID=153913 RepID=A0AA39USE4_9AGAR|nr:kinase-like domain-containing protein [Armillaria luteobubalina]
MTSLVYRTISLGSLGLVIFVFCRALFKTEVQSTVYDARERRARGRLKSMRARLEAPDSDFIFGQDFAYQLLRRLEDRLNKNINKTKRTHAHPTTNFSLDNMKNISSITRELRVPSVDNKPQGRIDAENKIISRIRHAETELNDLLKLIDGLQLGKSQMAKACHRYSRQLDQAAKNLSDAKMPNWDTFKGISRALEQIRNINESAVDKGPLWWLSSEPAIWNVISALSRTKEKDEQWVEDVLSLLQAVLQLGREEEEEKHIRNTVLNLKTMESPHISSTSKSRLVDIACVLDPSNTRTKQGRFFDEKHDIFTRIESAYKSFETWASWDTLRWIIHEKIIWDKIHLLADQSCNSEKSTRDDWQGKLQRRAWASSVLQSAQRFCASDRMAVISPVDKSKAAISLLRLSHWNNVSYDDSRKLIEIALNKFGGTDQLVNELLIHPEAIKGIVPSPISEGGSAVIYRGTCRIHGETKAVSVKKFQSCWDEKFALEAWTWREMCRTGSDYIVPFLGAVDIKTKPEWIHQILYSGGESHPLDASEIWLVSEWMAHGTLLRYISEESIGAHGKALLVSQVASAITWIHAHGVAHGDIKAENILVDAKGKVRLADFGISSFIDNEYYCYSGGDHGSAVGTTRWMAPERLMPEDFHLASARPTLESDVYSFAMLICQLYTGLPPLPNIPNDFAFRNLVARRKRRPSRPPDISDELWDVVMRCWSHEPGDRPTMESLNRDIKRILRGISAAASGGEVVS